MLKNKIYIHGKIYKRRPIDLVLKKILELRKTKAEFFKTKWKPWLADCDKVKIFWGKTRRNKKFSGPGTIFEFSEHGYTHNYVEGDFNAQVSIASDDKIALWIHDPLWKQHALAAMEDRLKGKTKQIVRRQDLVSRYVTLYSRDRHRSVTLETYVELLYSILYEKYSDQFVGRFASKKLLVIKSNGHDFYVQVSERNQLHLFNDVEIFNLQLDKVD
jgi:hypothetical protein